MSATTSDGTLSYVVKVDGSEIPAVLTLRSIRVSRSTGAASHVQLRVDMSNDANVSVFKVARAVTISLGWSDDVTEVFAGDIIGLAVSARYGQKELVVDAYDKSYRFGQSSAPQVFVKCSASDALQQLAGDVGLSSDIDDKLANPKFEYLPVVGTVQQFISELAARAGCEWLIDGGKLIVRPRKADGATAFTFDNDNIVAFDLRYTASTQTDGVTVRGWDPLNQEAIRGDAKKETLANTAKVMNGNKNTVSAKTAVIWPRTVVDSNDAAGLATAAKARMDAASLTGRVQVLLVPALLPGDLVEITGVDPEWNGMYYVTAVEHTVDGEGGVTRFTVGGLEPGTLVDLLGRADQPSADTMYSGLTIGVVTNINDEEQELGRVKVKLPYLDDQHETDFARVLQPGAGGGRGFQFLPEVNDEVLVAFEHGDRRRPIVLGGLWNRTAKPPPQGVVDGKVERRAMTSRLGHELLLLDGASDDKQLVAIVTAGKNAELVLAEDKITLTSKDKPITLTNGKSTITIDGGDVTIEADTITLTAKSGDVKVKGINVEVKSDANVKVEAGANLDLKGTAGAKLEAAANTVVKGAMVQIN